DGTLARFDCAVRTLPQSGDAPERRAVLEHQAEAGHQTEDRADGESRFGLKPRKTPVRAPPRYHESARRPKGRTWATWALFQRLLAAQEHETRMRAFCSTLGSLLESIVASGIST